MYRLDDSSFAQIRLTFISNIKAENNVPSNSRVVLIEITHKEQKNKIS